MRTAIIKLISACAGALIAAAICLHWLTAGTDEIVWGNSSTDSTQIMEGRPDAVGSVPFLIEKHRCWTGEEDMPADMAGVFPSHSIVTLKGGTLVYAGPVITGKALDQVFGKRDVGLKVHAFCR